jgi:hypothetical protein
MIDELRIEKDSEGYGCGLINIVFQHLPGGTEEKYENFSEYTVYIGDSNRAPLKYEFRALPLR